jgi:uncharacterized protein
LKEKDALDLLRKSGCSSNVVEHCQAVAAYAREIAMEIRICARKKNEDVKVDIDLVYIGGLLHDIGRSRTHGISHAVDGAKIAIENGLDEKLINIIERHIGAGIPEEEAATLGLPARDYMPLTLEEKIVAHADNLISGTRIGSIDEQIAGLRKKQFDEKIIHRIIELNNEICALRC